MALKAHLLLADHAADVRGMNMQTNKSGNPDAAERSEAMLRRVLDGGTYDAVASEFGITRTAVERRVKALAARLLREVGIKGMNADATAFVSRLRDARQPLLSALDSFRPTDHPCVRTDQVVTEEEINIGVTRIRARSSQPWRDVALFYMLFVTGARPLEIVRLCVADYLNEDGSVRRSSELRVEASITGRARPLFFASSKLDEALSHYLQQRRALVQGVSDFESYRGLLPGSRLFLTASGDEFRIVPYGNAGQRRFLCRPILETYRKLFRYAGLEGASPTSVRRTLVAQLYRRGADEEQVGLVLGITDRSAVRELFPRLRPDLASLLEELV